jgi:predicted dehydrogenase
MKIKKICIVGYGPHVEKTIIPSLSLKKKDIKIISSKPTIKNFDIFPNIKTALKKINKNYIIFNATPPNLHFETSKLILNMGFNLIIEKPICLNNIQLSKLKILSEKQGLFIFENMMYFYSKQFSIFKKYILNKKK